MAIKVLLVYLAVAILILFISSFVGFYLGGPDGATFALGIGLLIDLLVFPVVGLSLMSRLKAMAAEETVAPYSVPAASAGQVSVHKRLKSKKSAPPAEKPSA